mgnify:CR=1 FL=1
MGAFYFVDKIENMKNLKDIDVAGKKVLVRVDFNVPLNANQEITDDTRMQKALPTIKYLLDEGAKVILASHLGRPESKLKEDGSTDVEKFTLRNLVDHLAELTGTKVHFAASTIGGETEVLADKLQEGEILLLENTRFLPGEKKGDMEMAIGLSRLADVYVNDAFGTAHRAHASTATVAKYFDEDHKTLGFLMQNEIENANKVLNSPKRPVVAIVGGAKVSDKIQLLERLIEVVNGVCIGGGMAYTFIKAQGGDIGNSLCEDDYLDLAREILAKAKDLNTDIHLPEDSVIANDFNNEADIKTVPSDQIEDGWMGLDIGDKAIEEYSRVIKDAATILWNGPMGVFEMSNFSKGTYAVAQAVADATQSGAFSLIGGGDSVAAINKSGLSDEVSFVSTGGGAMLEYLEGKKLPGIEAIEKND